MSLGLWCVGVELEGGGRRRGEGQVRMCESSGAQEDLAPSRSRTVVTHVSGGERVWSKGTVAVG
jgi:hypothetical protein